MNIIITFGVAFSILISTFIYHLLLFSTLVHSTLCLVENPELSTILVMVIIAAFGLLVSAFSAFILFYRNKSLRKT